MSFNGRKYVPKKEVMKIKPGTLVRIMWLDAPDEVVMILKKPKNDDVHNKHGGEIDLEYMKADGTIESHATNQQVVDILDCVKWNEVTGRWLNRYGE